ncbi:MAG: alpha/beta hydrolase [Chitinophagales bacterium]|nr:alpha/beta hydrolase [Chitinophagales bacterium]MDW8427787.1 hypothetical protein [Chitinophagales bacterium]
MIYFFPGLATDGRLLNGYRFSEPVVVVNYPKPTPQETLEAYARRLGALYEFDDNSILIGFSLGGMIAAVIREQISVRKVITIASLVNCDRPWWISLPLWLPLHRWLPDRVLRAIIVLLGDVFTSKSREQRQLLCDMVLKADMDFVRWALEAVPRWAGCRYTNDIVKIHGDRDRLFPLSYAAADIVIAGGQHFVIVQQRPAVQSHLDRLLYQRVEGISHEVSN